MRKSMLTVFAVLSLVGILIVPFSSLSFRTRNMDISHSRMLAYSGARPEIKDFRINNTWCNRSTQWNFTVIDSVALANATFWQNITNNNQTVGLSGALQSVLFNQTLPSSNGVIAFNFWVNNTAGNETTTGERLIRTYAYNETEGAWNTPYVCLGDLISDVDSHNPWRDVGTYAKVVLDKSGIDALDMMLTDFAMEDLPGYMVNGTADTDGSGWTNPIGAIDGKQSTNATCVIPAGGTSNWLRINLSQPVRGRDISYSIATDNLHLVSMTVQIANFTGPWTQVFSGSAILNAVTNVTFAQSKFTCIEIQFGGNPLTDSIIYFNETWAWNIAEPDWSSFLKWGAFCNKLGIMSNHQSEIINCLGNFSMIQALPYTRRYVGSTIDEPGFSPEDKWALYGYYWAEEYGTALDLWNTTAAFTQFNASVYDSLNTDRPMTPNGYPLICFPYGLGETYGDRYYDECANTMECYVLFSELLNVSKAMIEALKVWEYLNVNHWNSAGQYFKYQPTDTGNSYECSAGFFLKIVSILQYYYPSLENWTNVLSDIGTRFLGNKWDSHQWLDSSDSTAYSVVHKYNTNPQRRLESTIAAWQALVGFYNQFDTSYKSNLRDMLYGNTFTEPAWALLLTPFTNLFDNGTKLFKWSTDNFSPTGGTTDSNATAFAEILLLIMGIVPGSTTTALPLEELGYLYLHDVDSRCLQLQMNMTSKTVVLSVTRPGSLTFIYGVSPYTVTLDKQGVWAVTFSESWNIICSVAHVSELPNNVIFWASEPIREFSTLLFLALSISVTLVVVIFVKKERKEHAMYRKSVG